MLTGIPFVDAHGSLRAGQMLEVCCVGGSGKTEILMQAAVNCVAVNPVASPTAENCTPALAPEPPV